MSVSFYAALAPAVAYAITCGCEPATMAAPRYGSYEDAVEALGKRDGTELLFPTALPGCTMPETCPGYDLHIEAIDADQAADDPCPAVNIGQVNAARILPMLGYEVHETGETFFGVPTHDDDMYGEADAQEFLGRVLMALAIEPADEGTDTHELPREDDRGPHVHQCGRRAGYTEEKLSALHTLAQWCAERGRPVVWA